MNLLAIGMIPSSGLPVRSQGGNSLTTPTATYFGWYYVLTHSSLLCLVWFLAAGSFRIVFTCDSITFVTTQMTRYFAQEKKAIHCEKLDNN